MLGLRTAEGPAREARQEQASARNWAVIRRSDIDGGPRRQDRESHNQPAKSGRPVSSQKGEGEGRTDRHTRRDDQRFNVVFCVLAIATDIVQERKVSIAVVVKVVMMARVEARSRWRTSQKWHGLQKKGDRSSVYQGTNLRKYGGEMLCQWDGREESHSIGRRQSYNNKQIAKPTSAEIDIRRRRNLRCSKGSGRPSVASVLLEGRHRQTKERAIRAGIAIDDDAELIGDSRREGSDGIPQSSNTLWMRRSLPVLRSAW